MALYDFLGRSDEQPSRVWESEAEDVRAHAFAAQEEADAHQEMAWYHSYVELWGVFSRIRTSVRNRGWAYRVMVFLMIWPYVFAFGLVLWGLTFVRFSWPVWLRHP